MKRFAATFAAWLILGGAGLTPPVWSPRFWCLVIGIAIVMYFIPFDRPKRDSA